MARIMNSTLFKLVHDFIKIYLPSQRCSSINTIRAYRTSLELFFDYIKKVNGIKLNEISFNNFNYETIAGFLNWLEISRHCGVTTRNHRLSCIKSFLNYTANIDSTTIIYQNILKQIPFKKVLKSVKVEYMSENAIKSLLEQPNTSNKKGIRDQFLMILLYDTGARIQEIIDLKINDIRLDSTPIIILHGKGSKIRSVPLMKKTVTHFKNYIHVFHFNETAYSEQYLFYVMRYGKKRKMSDDNILKFVKSYGLSARKLCSEVPENVYPHLFRHSRAMHLYQHGMDLTLISQWLGHADLKSTLIYAYADTEQKRIAIEKAMCHRNPLNEFVSSHQDENDDDILKKLYGLK